MHMLAGLLSFKVNIITLSAGYKGRMNSSEQGPNKTHCCQTTGND